MFSNRSFLVLLVAVCLPVMAFASTTELLKSAAEDGNVAFVLVTEPGASGLEEARKVIQEAIAQVSGSVMIESNRAGAENSSFVKEYDLATAPVPLILVFASNGVMAGGNAAAKLTEEKLVALIPSPKKAEALEAMQSGKATYVTASRSGMASKAAVAKGCAAACEKMQGKCVLIEVDLDDPVEKGFLTQLNIDLESAEPVTVVLNAGGQVTGSYTGVVEIDNLIASATKVVKSSCCPPGSGKSCAPAPKKGEK